MRRYPLAIFVDIDFCQVKDWKSHKNEIIRVTLNSGTIKFNATLKDLRR
jgi:hypothetical protein